jgi:hypothetical protein
VFADNEKARLLRLRDILTGAAEGASAASGETERLLDECDYLWAHFPERAGISRGGSSPPADDISFLKRVRTEIDSFLKLWEFVLKG